MSDPEQQSFDMREIIWGKPQTTDQAIDLTIARRIRDDHQGRDRAIKMQDLAEIYNMSDREIRERIGNLARKGCLIGTTTGDPPGVFWINSDEDRKKAIRNLEPRALKILVRLGRLNKSSMEGVFHQARMELGA